jgi:hypothetical protein
MKSTTMEQNFEEALINKCIVKINIILKIITNIYITNINSGGARK